MHKKGRWSLNKAQLPPSCHISITNANCAYWKEFVNDVNECVEEMKRNPELNKTSDSATYGMAASIPDQKLLQFFVHIVNETLLETI